MRTIALLTLFTAVLGVQGCYLNERVTNPSFVTSETEAQADERRMRADLKPLDRPVIVVGGYRSPDPFVNSMVVVLTRMTSGDRDDFLRHATWLENDIETAAAELVEEINDRFPSPSETETVEVDVVGLSMGGLISRFAADRLQSERPGARRLKINRLITLASPHRGAIIAEKTPLIEDRAVSDMIRSSLFITKLDEAYEGDYEIIPYVRCKDGVVGAVNAAPPGRTAIWVSAPHFGGSHIGISEDLRIITDVARRLRGEQPKGTEGEPLPDSEYGHR